MKTMILGAMAATLLAFTASAFAKDKTCLDPGKIWNWKNVNAGPHELAAIAVENTAHQWFRLSLVTRILYSGSASCRSLPPDGVRGLRINPDNYDGYEGCAKPGYYVDFAGIGDLRCPIADIRPADADGQALTGNEDKTGPAVEADIDCDITMNDTDRDMCSNSALWDLDSYEKKLFRKVVKLTGNNKAAYKSERENQELYLRNREQCKDFNCTYQTMTDRVNTLKNTLPPNDPG